MASLSTTFVLFILDQSFWYDFNFAILTGIITSLLFLVWITTIRPRIKISTVICRSKKEDGSSDYKIKFYNRHFFFDLYDIEMELNWFYPINNGDKANLKVVNLSMARNKISRVMSRMKGSQFQQYAWILKTEEDLDSLLGGSTFGYLELSIKSVHGFSSSVRHKTQRYSDKDVHIVDGKFESGASTKVLSSKA